MAPDPQTVLDLANQLTELQREDLAFQILESLPIPEGVPSIHDEDFHKELDRRAMDTCEDIPWERIYEEE